MSAQHNLLQVGFSSEGKLLALDLQLYSNAGNSLDLSASIMDRALLHCDVVYNIPNLQAQVRPHKAMAGVGAPQRVACLPS